MDELHQCIYHNIFEFSKIFYDKRYIRKVRTVCMYLIVDSSEQSYMNAGTLLIVYEATKMIDSFNLVI